MSSTTNSSSNFAPKPVQYRQPQQTAKLKKSLSQIVGIHAHSNLKIQHQLQLAETMYDASLKTTLDSRLCHNFDQCLSDECTLPYFLQFVESLAKSNAKVVVTCFLQSNCLMVFLKENFTHLDFEVLEQFDSVVLDEKQIKSFSLFIDDFTQLYNHFQLILSNCDDDHDYFGIEDNLRNQLSLLFGDLKNDAFHLEDYSYALELFYLFWKALYQEIESRYYELFLRSNFYLKYELEILKSDTLELSDILHSSTAIASCFMDFMNSEDMKRFVDFLIMHKNYKTYSGQHSDALAIYDRFFNYANKSSNNFFDFSESIHQELQMAVRQTPFNPDCFDKVAFILIQYFSKTYLPQFLQSVSFHDYITSCEAKLRAERFSTAAARLARTRSTEEGSHLDQSAGKRGSNASSHSNDLTSANDSESLWRRSLKGQLQVTYIDNYGRMSSLFEPEPAAKGDGSGLGGSGAVISTGNKLSNVIKRLTHSNALEEKKKEDDAWRIAESIINDVCSVTIDHSCEHSATGNTMSLNSDHFSHR